MSSVGFHLGARIEKRIAIERDVIECEVNEIDGETVGRGTYVLDQARLCFSVRRITRHKELPPYTTDVGVFANDCSFGEVAMRVMQPRR